MNTIELKAPYLVFLGDAEDLIMAKVAKGIAHWRPEKCLAQMRLPEAKAKLDILKKDYLDPNSTPKQIYFNIFDNVSGYKNCFKTETFKIPLNLEIMSDLQSLFDSQVSLIMKGTNGTKRYS